MITFEQDFKSTKSFNSQIVNIYHNDLLVAKGVAKYINRPWESYNYKNALLNTLNRLPLNEDLHMRVLRIAHNSNSFSEAVKQITPILEGTQWL